MIISNKFNEQYNEGTVVYVQRPSKRIIHYFDQKYFLSFPYVGFSFNYCSIPARRADNDFRSGVIEFEKRFYTKRFSCVFSTDPDLKDMYYASLPNVWLDTAICSDYASLEIRASSVDNLCKEIVSNFWASSFNQDLNRAFRTNYPLLSVFSSSLPSFYLWSMKTKINKQWIPNKRELREIKNPNFRRFFFDNTLFNPLPHSTVL